MVQVLNGPASFPAGYALSVLSYNVLLPNSQDGWWTYKMYSPPLDASHKHVASWEYRRDLIKERICAVDASIVCFQEVSPVSFEEDFAFMEELGYDGREMFRKGRFRPATFWKSSECELASPSVHKDRTLLTALRPKRCDSNWYILNCHLQAGKQAPRRVRQINEGVRSALTLARKLKEKKPEEIPLIVCGDFNGGDECGAVRYLEDGFVDDSFLEDGEPVTSGKKELPLSGSMVDVMALPIDRQPLPPTLVVSELISLMIAPKESESGKDMATAWENPDLSSDMIQRLCRIHAKLASKKTSHGKVMTLKDVEKWLTIINLQVGRGDEFREAARQMGWKPGHEEPSEDEPKERIELPLDGELTEEGFIAVYLAELRGGKFWGIAHDMAVLGDPLNIKELFQARLDRMYASNVVKTTAVMDFLSAKPCPNEKEASDHLPIAAAFSL